MRRRAIGRRLAPALGLTALLALGSTWSGGALAQTPPTSSSLTLAAEPGDFLTVPLTRPGAGAYQVTAELPPGWALLTEALEAGEGGPAFAALHLPEDALAGPQALVFVLTDAAGAAQRVAVTVVVGARPEFTVTLPDTDRVRPGERKTYVARVTNLGNVRDTLRLEVEGSATVTPDRVTLEPLESAEVRVVYTQRGPGDGDLVRLTARSSVDADLSREALLGLRVGLGAGAGAGPQLTWSVEVSPGVGVGAVQPDVIQPDLTPVPLPEVPTLPGLPTLPGNPEDAAAPAGGWAWFGGVSAAVQGQLSDYAAGGITYAARRDLAGQLRDEGTASLQWGDFGVQARTRDLFRTAEVGAEYRLGAYSLGLNTWRTVGEGGEATYGVAASASHRSGAYLSAAQTFGADPGNALTVGWSRPFGAWTPLIGVSAVRHGDEWGYGLSQGLSYENAWLLVRQTYAFDSVREAHDLQVQVSSRQQQPFGVSAAAQLNRVGDVTRTAASAQLSYRPNEDLGVVAGLSYGSDGFGARLLAVREWQLGRADLFVLGQAEYRRGEVSGAVQATAALDGLGGEWRLSGLLGYAGGSLLYGAGAGYLRGPLEVSGGVQGRGSTLEGTFHVAYRPERGLYAGADYVMKATGLSGTGLGLTHDLRAQVGYGTDRWSAGLVAAYAPGAGEGGRLSYGVTASGQLLPWLSVQGQALLDGGHPRFTVGGRLTPGGSFATPDAVVSLFGGRNAGTLTVRSYADRNRNGARDPGEPGVATELLVGGQALSTNAAGEASVLLRPGPYTVELGEGVLAQYVIPVLPPVEVRLRGSVTLEIPVREVATLQGRVLDGDGRPVVGAQLSLSGPGGAVQAVTDSTGAYRLSGLDFGPYQLGVGLDPALYLPLAPVALTLSREAALVTRDLRVTGTADVQGVTADELGVQVYLPDDPRPPGTTLPVTVEVEPGADAVTLEGLGVPLALRPEEGGRVWRGLLPLPPEQRTSTEVQVVARRGEARATARALVLIDAELPLATLQVVPLNALPGQVMELRAVVYSAATRVQVRSSSGQVTELLPGADHTYRAELRADPTPGEYSYTLLVDGQPRAEGRYRVLGRP
ncbi:carboxypeptidase regulatory-like domain-containing protein [Deinococcus sp. SDU3-2]|uniref:Carboxypeptidase regulatory-like domain-containing protein n=1 Tax=Deinococcus terrestris TaxID=2651870 RepID=A0A7X1TRI2_9DEIO|nr:carboxypeptidase-like regulatory domain-containing protein [Deinococcus terrestris]MPY66444.1 carboxypeptidase regulatory-like domain-containing protein [Deinococcus terrestris]